MLEWLLLTTKESEKREKSELKDFLKILLFKLQVCYTVDHHTQPLTAFSKKKSMSPFSRMKNLL